MKSTFMEHKEEQNRLRQERLKEALKKTVEDDAELLDRLDDFDENGVPYWDQQIHD
ncbi:hypothetical protein UFOVP27_138 [uncultured Caudovirales phage]|uniref:Uncharacterized protein n=1 Tax=uncultured Caudovirales phage TaxID=2100421 RepID=A0A6J5KLU5_9CAUD|nr:hypothetical protein UFOVP27_138 [uncultured Caudovirales phage]